MLLVRPVPPCFGNLLKNLRGGKTLYGAPETCSLLIKTKKCYGIGLKALQGTLEHKYIRCPSIRSLTSTDTISHYRTTLRTASASSRLRHGHFGFSLQRFIRQP